LPTPLYIGKHLLDFIKLKFFFNSDTKNFEHPVIETAELNNLLYK